MDMDTTGNPIRQPTIEEQMTAIERAQRQATPTQNSPLREGATGGMSSDSRDNDGRGDEHFGEPPHEVSRVPTDRQTED